jgi:ACT domain-containing protein
LGRPKYVLPDNFNDVAAAYYLNKINIRDALSELEMTKSTFYRYYNMYITFAKNDKL